jgi:hypothetical protein
VGLGESRAYRERRDTPFERRLSALGREEPLAHAVGRRTIDRRIDPKAVLQQAFGDRAEIGGHGGTATVRIPLGLASDALDLGTGESDEHGCLPSSA